MKPPPHFGPHVTRWVEAGFDIAAASLRYNEFRATLKAADTEVQAARVIQHYVQDERATLLASVPEADPDIWRIDALPKYIDWQR